MTAGPGSGTEVSRAPLESTAQDAATRRRIFTTALFRGDREIVIVHHGQEYRLRITKADKLILTK